MINYEEDKIINFDSKKIIKGVVAVIISIILTLLIINFIPFSDMLDDLKISFKSSILSEVVKYFSFIVSIISIIIYAILHFFVCNIIEFVLLKLKKEDS